MKIAGLFAGIGGIEAGFQRALGNDVETVLLCEWWGPAKQVLTERFPEIPLHPDVRDLRDLPSDLDVVAAGFPCTDLSQAGRTAGIKGEQSGLVKHVFDVLKARVAQGAQLPSLLVENVPNMLSLDRGEAMKYLIREIESLGYKWAYRVVDTRASGLPHRRRRVILFASTIIDPARVLFADESSAPDDSSYRDDAFGFYWTEGRGGLGWAKDAVPTLKGGSTLGIPSPPAIWVPGAKDPQRMFVTPTVSDAEAMQGFARGWTDMDFGMSPARTIGTRWKLVGNAVSTGISEWVASRIANPGSRAVDEAPWDSSRPWPTAASGYKGAWKKVLASEYPMNARYSHLMETVDFQTANPLSARALAGFRSRLNRGNLGRHPGFREAVDRVDLMNSDLASAMEVA